MAEVDCIVAGAGAVGLAVARELALAGDEVLVLESAAAIGTGTSSRNSEVIHAGIYYPTNSLKAELCVAGKAALYRFCAKRDVAHRRIGKLIVAVNDSEIPRLEEYKRQAEANGVRDLEWLSAGEVRRREPEVICARALLSPSTGILDTHEYMLALQADLESAEGLVAFNAPVAEVVAQGDGFSVQTGGADPTRIQCRRFINAAGLHAPALAGKIHGLAPEHVPQAFFAKGHYYSLRGKSPFKQLIYPLAGEGGLGIHVTLDMAGAARFGPDVSWVDDEDYSFDDARRGEFEAAIRRYYPGLESDRLQSAYTGIRPKIVGPGAAAADFLLQDASVHGVPGLVNLFGIESPGITASLAIAARVRAQLAG